VVRRLCGTFELRRQGGLYRTHPALAALFLIPALSLGGMPPLSGFFAKLPLLQAGLGMGQYAIVATALVVGLLTLFSTTKIWAEAFWKPGPPAVTGPEGQAVRGVNTLLLPIAMLASLTVSIGLAAGPVFVLATRAAEQLIDREGYIRAVLGGPP
jgi:multicomponent Na+:H+ antiporter subunit D